MNGTRHKTLITLLFLLCTGILFSQSSKKRSGNGNRIHFGPLVGFYRINTHHAAAPSPKMSASVGFKREQKIGRDYRTFFLFGFDYFFHGCNFRSYYFAPDTFKIYDKNFAYNYSLFIHELDLPLQVKYLFKREDNSLFSPYVVAGYHLRYLLPARLKVSQDGNELRSDNPELKFKTPLILDQLNAMISLGFGWQKNSLSSSKGSFFAEINYRYAFSALYFQTDYSASSLFINSAHLNLQLGFKF
ncbi:MAG: outer membrane beta-barrel protein [Bacteroidia bacterium]|nr:outer membrane beta-barrel protein [Bacteroidia bacterium]